MIRIFKRWYFCIVCTILPYPKGGKPPVLILLEDDANVKIK